MQAGVTVLQCSDWDESKAQAGTELIIMVGPSGSGKSTLIDRQILSGLMTKGSVISSDDIRADLCGDFKDQSRNEDVFAAMHSLAKTRLSHGLSVVLDATHLRRKDRIAAAQLGLPNSKVSYRVINRPLDVKLRDAGWRKDVKLKNGVSLIEAHEQTFKSQLKDILAGDGLTVEVIDMRVI